jgi:predicted Zn finger-like uncharacterized protein
MVVECQSCNAKYNVDENKLPAAGVKVRCHKCQNIITIKKPAPPPVAEPVAPAAPVPPPQVPVEPQVPEVAPSAIPEPAPIPQPEPPRPEIKAPVVETPSPPPPDVAPPTIVHEPVPVVQPTPVPAQQLSAEDKKWHERAKRLAKALASDLVLYNQAKVEQGLRDGTLVQLLGSEIRRSWEYYCQQIPKHIVESTDYFKEQLNKVVGKGKELFK